MSLSEIIREATQLINPPNPNQPQLPEIKIPPYGERSETSDDPYNTIINEPRPPHLKNLQTTGEANSFCTPPASPHTPKIIEINGVKYPAHVIVWWYGEANGSRKYPTIIDLARMTPEQRAPYLQVIAAQITNAVLFFKENHPEITSENLHSFLEIYGLAGYTDPETRKTTGLSRGAQSHPMGHLNIVYHPYDKYPELAQLVDINPRQFLKQISPMDTEVFNRWKSILLVILEKLILSKNPNLPVSVKSEINYEKKENSISFYEGLTITFNQPQEVVQSLEILCQVIGFFDGLYNIIQQGYENYYQHIGDEKGTLQDIKNELIKKVELYFAQHFQEKIFRLDEFISRIVDFALSFHPTYQQLIHWQQLDNVSQQTKDKLRKLQLTYEKIQDFIQNPEKKPRLIKWLKQFYQLTDFEVEAYLQFFIDMTLSANDRWKEIEFTWAKQLSLSYLFDKYEIGDDDDIKIKQIKIAPRIFTNKGVFEDLAGMMIKRPQGI